MPVVQFGLRQFSARRILETRHGYLSCRFSYQKKGSRHGRQSQRILATSCRDLWTGALFRSHRTRRPRFWRFADRYYSRHAPNFRCPDQTISHFASSYHRQCWLARHYWSSCRTGRCLAYHFNRGRKFRFHLPCRKRHARYRRRWFFRCWHRQFSPSHRLPSRIYQRLCLCHYGRNFWLRRVVHHHCDFCSFAFAHARCRQSHLRYRRPPPHSRRVFVGFRPDYR